MKKAMILDAGLVELATATAMMHADAEVFVVDRANYNLFQPLLYKVATICAFLQLESRVRSVDF